MFDSGALDVAEAVPQQDREVPCARLIGRAGSGKTTMLQRRVQADPHDVLLTSTTGISAVNLGCITLHSTLGYFNTDSMRDAYLTGQLARKLHEIAREYHWLAVEEYSMLDADALDILYRATIEANRYADVTTPLGLLLVGDLAQLPPVKARWCFEASCWGRFAANTERLEHVWRQDTGAFLDALNHVRDGRGAEAARLLTDAGAIWHTALDTEFDGTTILPKNDMVNRYNDIALDRVRGPRVTVTSRRWGRQRSEWGENPRTHEWGIPPRTDFKVGAYVMVLTNDTPDFTFVNGDCGFIEAIEPSVIHVKLLRTGATADIYKLVRGVEQSERPDGFSGPSVDEGEYVPREHYRRRVRRYVLGQVEYFPLRLAYASTVHKSQSLTLDRVQADFRDWFFGKPAMLYVALSRCRTLAGLRLVGMREKFVVQCATDPRIKEWL